MNQIVDVKSFLIGFLLALVVLLLIGAGANTGIQEVRIVGVSSSAALPVTLKDTVIKVELNDIKYGIELPVVIKKQLP